MLLKDAFKTATRSLTHGKMRSILTMLGIVIGIASVIILMSIGASAQGLILNQVQGIGSNLVFVIPGGSTSGRFSAPAAAQGIVVKSLKQTDINGEFKYSELITVENCKGKESIEVYPNPARLEVFVRSTEEAVLEIINVFGESLSVQKLNAGINKIDLSTFQNATYFFRTENMVGSKFSRIVVNN